jgi:hypothetical protein
MSWSRLLDVAREADRTPSTPTPTYPHAPSRRALWYLLAARAGLRGGATSQRLRWGDLDLDAGSAHAHRAERRSGPTPSRSTHRWSMSCARPVPSADDCRRRLPSSPGVSARRHRSDPPAATSSGRASGPMTPAAWPTSTPSGRRWRRRWQRRTRPSPSHSSSSRHGDFRTTSRHYVALRLSDAVGRRSRPCRASRRLSGKPLRPAQPTLAPTTTLDERPRSAITSSQQHSATFQSVRHRALAFRLRRPTTRASEKPR